MAKKDGATICGVRVQMSREEVLERARQALKENERAAKRYRDWYVLVDGQPVSPKWIVSHITGLPTSEFDAGRARALLIALGVQVEGVMR